jgi:hypothetical protein
MAQRFRAKKPRNALKHGGYSTMGLLPGESPAEFEKLHKNLIGEFAPQGPLEEDIVSTIARLLWRKQNLATFRTAESARQRRNQIIQEEMARRKIPDPIPHFPMLEINEPEDAEMQAARKYALQEGEQQARDELGEYYELTQRGYHTDALTKDLDVEERLDAAIDKCIKRLLMVRGVKSMSAIPPTHPMQLPKSQTIKRPADPFLSYQTFHNTPRTLTSRSFNILITWHSLAERGAGKVRRGQQLAYTSRSNYQTFPA